VPASAALIH